MKCRHTCFGLISPHQTQDTKKFVREKNNYRNSWWIYTGPNYLQHQYTDCIYGKGKVKCTPVQALRLCTGRTAHRGSRSIALLFHDHGTRRGWGIKVTPRPLFTPGKDPVPIVQEHDGWAPGPVWTGAGNFVPTGIRSPDRPARSQSLYRLSYPGHPLYIRAPEKFPRNVTTI